MKLGTQKIYAMWFYLHKILKLAKLISGDGSQNSVYLQGIVTGKVQSRDFGVPVIFFISWSGYWLYRRAQFVKINCEYDFFDLYTFLYAFCKLTKKHT